MVKVVRVAWAVRVGSRQVVRAARGLGCSRQVARVVRVVRVARPHTN